jgi:hypothetical protein
MPPQEAAAARPRSLVEILDDAWRLVLADAPLLLALVLLFWMPAATGLVALVCMPSSGFWLAPLTTSLLLLAGLSAGACQEAFHSWAEGYEPTFGECLRAAGKRSALHVASQALTLLPSAAAFVLLVSPELPGFIRFCGGILLLLVSLALAPFSLTRQPGFAAGKVRFWRAIGFGFRACGDRFGSAVLLVFLRFILLVFAVLNLHLMIHFALWVAEDPGGMDLAYASALLSLGNTAYVLAISLLAWCCLLPLHEASAYLFFVDLRTRHEGLDLWERVEKHFPISKLASTAALLLTICVCWLTPGSARAEEPLEAVRWTRGELAIIKAEVETANPYPGGKQWLPRLQSAGKRLEDAFAKPDAVRWFSDEVREFSAKTQKQASAWLDDVDAKLAVLEESFAQARPNAKAPSSQRIKELVPPNGRKTAKAAPPVEKQEDLPKQDPGAGGQGGGFGGVPVGGGVVPAGISLGGLGAILPWLLVIAFGVVVGLAIGYAVYAWWSSRLPAKPKETGQLAQPGEAELPDPQRLDPAELWRQADERAAKGDFLGGVRTLYLAVLALLHRGGFIRCERTKTNGEYADQLRKRKPLQRPFLGLTGLFELKWFGERTCERTDYSRCRELAEEIRAGSLEALAGTQS